MSDVGPTAVVLDTDSIPGHDKLAICDELFCGLSMAGVIPASSFVFMYNLFKDDVDDCLFRAFAGGDATDEVVLSAWDIADETHFRLWRGPGVKEGFEGHGRILLQHTCRFGDEPQKADDKDNLDEHGLGIVTF